MRHRPVAGRGRHPKPIVCLKILFLDVGLTQALLGLDTTELILDAATAVSHRGAIAKAFVGQESIAYGFASADRELFYWHREARGSSAEVDYLIEDAVRSFPSK
jgi:predicted AAA+ superfamily ATPase